MLRWFLVGFFAVATVGVSLLLMAMLLTVLRCRSRAREGVSRVEPHHDFPAPGDTSLGLRDWCQPGAYTTEAPRV